MTDCSRRLSMVYSFFDPSEVGRSLGTFMILDHIARARGRACLTSSRLLDRGSKKMDYKGRFLPQQRLPLRLAARRRLGRRGVGAED